MSKFHFCITTGVDGYLPDRQDFIAADCSVDAYDAIVGAIGEFREEYGEVREASDWKMFFERGSKKPDASMWSFNLATTGDGIWLSVTGLTANEYATHGEEE